MPTFFYGGFTGNKAIASDKYGDIVGGVHKNEWVAPEIMTQNPMYAANFAYLENERKRLTGKTYFNGGPTTETTSETIADPLQENQLSENILLPTLNRISNLLEVIESKGFVAVLSDDLRGIKRLRQRFTDLENLENKNIR